MAGGFVGSVIYVINLLITSAGIHFSGPQDMIMLPLPGLMAGVVLGAIFPKPFFKLARLDAAGQLPRPVDLSTPIEKLAGRLKQADGPDAGK